MKMFNGALALCAALTVAATPALAEDEAQVFNAFAIAVANGTIVRSAEKQATIAGTVAGPMFVETDEGPIEAGRVTCSVMVKVDQGSRRVTGGGACSFVADDAAAAWGEWECTGYLLLGCRGKLTLNGGSGRFAGVSGESTMTWRPSAGLLKQQIDGPTIQNWTGVLSWRDFKLARSKP
jgi:hypothetical protein